ncbi:DUF2459 domain-containing protein [Spartinivicinus poritis]|uniref:DUF2459 domain-containing protein n=1 Tax=Spartinivicinus poritis TaxID=2994640 RepID=A0ABT5UDI6_9GAMM|nr:DUF2459 domain-containing protein [Spartinivicinus sp. A2-2]MDE1464436.1 DUF2459 domain-containing protein [Spartinivicinus sp. A2-2]
MHLQLKRFVTVIFILLLLTNCNSHHSWGYLADLPHNERSIFLVSHGWHTGLVIATKNLTKELIFLQDYFNNGLYFEIGWGDKDFYQANQVTSAMTLKAAFWPTNSVLHVVGLATDPTQYFSNSEVIEIKISAVAHQQLNLAIADSFQKDATGAIVPIQEGLYGDSHFFNGTGYFYLTNNCNNWTAKQLITAGVPISTMTFTATGLIKQVKEANKYYQCCIQLQ